jgi:glycerophosphoryl diester phosphodiesterase
VSRRADRAIRPRPIGFAHRGASALAAENTLAAFRLAVDLGATGLESDVHVSKDGIAMLVHDPRIPIGDAWLTIRERTADELGAHDIPALTALYAQVGTTLPLSLDLNDADPLEAADAVVAAASAFGPAAVDGLLLCHGDRRVLERLGARFPAVRLVHSTAPRYLPSPAEHAWRLADLGVQVINLHWEDWGTDDAATAAIDGVHRAGLRAFAWDTQTAVVAERMARLGVDGLYADDPRVLLGAVGTAAPS